MKRTIYDLTVDDIIECEHTSFKRSCSQYRSEVMVDARKTMEEYLFQLFTNGVRHIEFPIAITKDHLNKKSISLDMMYVVTKEIIDKLTSTGRKLIVKAREEYILIDTN